MDIPLTFHLEIDTHSFIRKSLCNLDNFPPNIHESYYASVTTRRTCYGSCVSGAVAELRFKFCVSCGWLGSENNSAITVPATHVSCGRRASDATNRTQKIPQRRHVQRTGAVPSRYLQRAFAVPPATCPYGGVRVCTSVARRRCVEGTTHVRHTHGHILPAQSIYSELIIGIPEKFIFNLY